MRAVLHRDLLLMSRGGSFRVALLGYLLVLILSSSQWYAVLSAGRGGGAGGLEQRLFSSLVITQWLTLALLAPWVASLLMVRDRDDNLVSRLAMASLKPWQWVVGKALAAGLYLALLLVISFPVMTIAYLLGAATWTMILVSHLEIIVFGALALLITFHLSFRNGNLLLSLTLSYLAAAILAVGYLGLVSLIGPAKSDTALAAMGGCTGLLLIFRCNRSLVYLKA